MKISQGFIDGSTLMGVALTMFGVGSIVQTLWQKLSMFGLSFIWLIISIFAFNRK